MTDSLIQPAELSESMRLLRWRLGTSVLGKLSLEISGFSAHFGEDYEFTDEPEAVVYRRTGGAFRFLAFSCSPWRMWDFHVGVVPTDDTTLSIGIHISERAEPILRGRLSLIATNLKTDVVHAPGAVEYQANLSPIDVTRVPFDAIDNQLVALCRELPPVVAAVICPASMRSG